MSLLYKPKEEQKTSVEFKQLSNGEIELIFSSDCGKFGTDEILDIHTLTPKKLLEVVQNAEDLIFE